MLSVALYAFQEAVDTSVALLLACTYVHIKAEAYARDIVQCGTPHQRRCEAIHAWNMGLAFLQKAKTFAAP